MLLSIFASTGLSFKYPSISATPNILTDGTLGFSEPDIIILPVKIVLPSNVLLPT